MQPIQGTLLVRQQQCPREGNPDLGHPPPKTHHHVLIVDAASNPLVKLLGWSRDGRAPLVVVRSRTADGRDSDSAVVCSDLLSMCNNGQSPLDRLISMVAWCISTTRPVTFGVAPYNLILVGSDWTSTLKKRLDFRAAFSEFDAETVANLTDKQMMSISSEYGIDISRVRGAVDNANQILEIKKDFGSFDKYIWGFVNHKPLSTQYKFGHKISVKTSKSESISKDMVRRGFSAPYWQLDPLYHRALSIDPNFNYYYPGTRTNKRLLTLEKKSSRHKNLRIIFYLICSLSGYWVTNSLPLSPFSALLTKAYNTANVLFEVLKAVNMTQSMEVDREVIFLKSWHLINQMSCGYVSAIDLNKKYLRYLAIHLQIAASKVVSSMPMPGITNKEIGLWEAEAFNVIRIGNPNFINLNWMEQLKLAVDFEA
ncbi:hypothetical protein JHK85_006960 [Glycine max]|nr:hypothetical protein JHK85_006960 [Glycine max]